MNRISTIVYRQLTLFAISVLAVAFSNTSTILLFPFFDAAKRGVLSLYIYIYRERERVRERVRERERERE